jgi:hypothetical protein
MVDPNVRTLKMKVPASATTPLTLDVLHGGEINVKSFNAAGDGSTDDTNAIQTAFNAAFTSAATLAGGTPNGVNNAHLNKGVFFPAGHYKITSPIVLTDVYGACIRGSGRWTSTLDNTAGGTCIRTNGFSHNSISQMELNGGIPLDLDWSGGDSGTGVVGLAHNLFENLEFNGNTVGCRIAHAGAATAGRQGHGNQFLHCSIGTNAVTTFVGFLIEGQDALATHICGGNTNTPSDIGVKCVGGSVNVECFSFQTTNTCDVYVSNAASGGRPCSVMGCRSESLNHFIGVGPGRAFISAVHHIGQSGGSGVWTVSTAYTPGANLLDLTDYIVYQCTVGHTSASSGTFAADRAGAASGKWTALPIGIFANITNYNLTCDAVSSGDLGSKHGGGKLLGNSGSKFYSRGCVFIRDITSSGGTVNDFFTGFAGTHTPGTMVI